MKNLFKKILACCLVVCMVFTLCISAVTVSAEEATFDGALTIGNAEVAAGAKEATVSFTALAEKDGIAAAKVNVTLPDGATGISKVELVEADENVQVTFGVSEGKPLVELPGENPEDPDGEDVYVYEGDVNIIENVFSYILWVYNYEVDVTKVAATVEITFVGDFNETAPVNAAIEACKDDVDLLNLQVVEGAINVTAAHTCTPAEAVQENVKPATCYAEGSYDEVVYCSDETCKKELSRTAKTIDKIAHTPAEAVVENEVVATCYAKGSYDSVVYCSVEACKFEISRTPVTVDETEHTPATAVVEKEVAATCLAAGSYDSVVYCSVAECKHEISRTTIPVEALKHDYTYKNDGDTHSATCPNGCAGITGEAHNYVDGECVCGAVEKVACEHANKVLVEATPASSEQPGLLDYDCPDCDDDDSIDITVIYKSDLTTFVTPAISCEATTILRLKTAKTTNFSTYTDGLLVTTHNYQNGATSTTDYYNMSEVPVVSSRYQLDVPVIYTQFTDTFDCAMYVESGDIWYSNGATTYSLKDVAMMYINADSTAAANRYAAANLLKVGAAAQTEFNYAKNNLADNELDGCEFVENEVPTISNQNGVNYTDLPSDYTTAGKVFYVTPGVVLNDSIAITLKANKAYYNGGELDNLRLEYVYTKENGTQVPGEITKFEIDNKGRFLFTLGVDAPDMRSVITFSLYNGDVKVADDAVYSIEGAMAAYYNAGSYTALIERVMIYSDVVAKYF